MTKLGVLITGQMMPTIMDQLETAFTAHKLHEAKDRDAMLKAIAPDVAAICTSGFTGVKCDDAFMARFPKLKVISNFGVGYDSIDPQAAARRGVIVTNTPDVLTEEVADTSLGLLLMTVRELGASERYLRAGKWATDGDYRLTPGSLRDRKVGMVGYGRIGKAIAKRIEAFGVPVSYFGRRKQEGVVNPFYSDLVQMARDVDTLMVITPGGPDTKNLIDGAVLAALGSRGIVINMARGSVVDETALIDALRKRTILAAGLDVMLNEPKINPELMTLDNCVLLPHVGSASEWTRDKMGQLTVDNLVACKDGKPPLTPVIETPFTSW